MSLISDINETDIFKDKRFVQLIYFQFKFLSRKHLQLLYLLRHKNFLCHSNSFSDLT